MASPLLVYHSEGVHDKGPQEDLSSLRLTPTSTENYRCPVSTPANYVQRQSRIRRTKPLEDIYSRTPTTGGRSRGSHVTDVSRRSRNVTLTAKSWTPKVSSGVAYYFVDKRGDKKEAEQTNNPWLKALCAQPVSEILNKYRRKTDVQRTRVIWSKTFTTPGEKSLLSAWENNVIRGRGQKTRSAIVGGARTRGVASLSAIRLTQSEPPLSRAQNYDVGDGLSPGRVSNDPRNSPGFVTNGQANVENDFQEGSAQTPRSIKQRRIKGFLLDESTAGSRVTYYTTQYFAPKGGAGGPVYSKVIEESPEQLPRMSARHKVASMLYDTNYYNRGGALPPSHSSSLPRSPSPIPEDDNAVKEHTEDQISQS